MKFCSVCDMYYYISIDETDENKLIYYCRNCGNKEETSLEGHCVLNTQIQKSEQTFHHIVNKYTKLDPTLPRINNIPCTNDECQSNATEGKKVDRDIIYIRYDDVNLKYIYICGVCDKMWKNTTD